MLLNTILIESLEKFHDIRSLWIVSIISDLHRRVHLSYQG